jgi:hypothetical protein
LPRSCGRSFASRLIDSFREAASIPCLRSTDNARGGTIINVFRITSPGDYIAHRRLWGFLVERMRDNLERRGIAYPDAWEAYLFT